MTRTLDVPMTDAKETRTHAFEIKFVVDAQMGERIRAWARTFLNADPHGTGPFIAERKAEARSAPDPARTMNPRACDAAAVRVALTRKFGA